MSIRAIRSQAALTGLALAMWSGLVLSCSPSTAVPADHVDPAPVTDGSAMPTNVASPTASLDGEAAEAIGPPASATDVAAGGAADATGKDAALADNVVEVSTAVAARTPVPTPTPARVDQGIAKVTSDLGISGVTVLGLTAEDWLDLGVSVLILALAYFVGVKLLGFFLGWLANRTSHELDNALVKHLEPDLSWLVALVSSRYAVLRLDFLSADFRTAITDLFFGLGVAALTAVGIRIIRYVAAWYKESLTTDEERARLTPVISTSSRISIVVLLVIVFSLVLAHFGIDIGVLSVAVLVIAVVASIGARDLVSDAISGLIILIDQPFRVHDGLQIEELGTWGDVIEIGSRTTRILTRDYREVIIPNTKLLNSRIVNYTVPDPEYRMQVDLRIAYSYDIDLVRQAIHQAVIAVDGVLNDKGVDVLFVGYGRTARVVRVRWWVRDYHAQFVMLDAVCTAIQSGLEHAGFEIPVQPFDFAAGAVDP